MQDDTRQALMVTPLWFVVLAVGYWIRTRNRKV
ncbi:L-asparagine transporter-like permease [Ewingella americana]